MAKIYRGFSIAGWKKRGSFKLYDIELVKRDLMNHIYTIKGEHRMMPNFGTRIPLLAFEQADAETLKIIEDDIREVINYDPRVKLIDLQIMNLSDNNAIVVLCDLYYIEFDVRDVLRIEVGG
jgi:phage baseplate assembly protein W